METNTSSPPPSLQEQRVRVRPILLITSMKPRKLLLSPLLCFLINISLFAAPCASYVADSSQIVYSTHCNHIVPESPLEPSAFLGGVTVQNLRLQSAFFSGGTDILGEASQSNSDQPNYVIFNAHNARRTLRNETYAIKGNLLFQTPQNVVYRPMLSKGFRVRGPRFPVRRGVASFKLSGYWSQSTGKLCMVGSGSSFKNAKTGNLGFFNVVLKLDYPVNSSAFDSLVKGVLESVDGKSRETDFEPISILGVSKILNYEYRLTEKGNGCLSGNKEGENLPLNEANGGLCSLLGQTSRKFELDYGSDCYHETSCNVVGAAGKYMSNVMFFKGTRCSEDQKMQMLLGFRNSSTYSSRFPFDPHSTLIAEGSWDQKKNRLCAVACRILNITESLTGAFVGNCSTNLILRFPAVLSLRNQSTMLGQIYSDATKDEVGYSGKITFHSFWEDPMAAPGLKYKYTEMDTIEKYCLQKTSESRGKTYPNGYSLDMRFDMSVTDSKGKLSRGYASPLFVGNQLSHGNILYGPGNYIEPLVRPNENNQNLLNISYRLSFTPTNFISNHDMSLSEAVHMSAEGIYDKSTGILCMRGCRHLRSNDLILVKNDSMDCGLFINVQFPPLNAKGGETVKGTITSTRKKSDPLYFEHLELSSNSIYTMQAKESIWRMDLEITMVLISNTLACVFVGMQLFYVKKHPEMLPFISVVMLLILTLGYMIPLLLNFEALFLANPNRQNVFLGGGGWLEVNEIIVRVVTMIAFLLQFRLLQLTWTARQSYDDGQKGLWNYEKKVLYVSLPVYILGGFVALFSYYKKNSHRSPFLLRHGTIPSQRHLYRIYSPRNVYKRHSLWDGLKSYAGLVLDNFLLPQILLNLFLDSREMALAASFYTGTTLVRLLPHAYDLYRAHSSSWVFELTYIYADHGMDFYSTAWNIVIPCGGLLLALLIFLQQRFGGRCILPKRFAERASYEMVPVGSEVELQGEQTQKNLYTL